MRFIDVDAGPTGGIPHGELLHTLAEHTPAGMFAMDASDTPVMLYANRAFRRITGFADEGGPQDAADLLSCVHHDDVERVNRLMVTGGSLRRFDFRFCRAGTDELRWLHVDATDVQDPNGRRLVQGVVEDVTEQHRSGREQQQELERGRALLANFEHVERMRSAFLRSLSHELRTPLVMIESGGRMLADRWDDLGEGLRFELVSRIAANGERLGKMLRDMLDVTQAAQVDPSWSLEISPVDLAELVADEVGARAWTRHEVSVDAVPAPILADREAVTRIIGHLLDNAHRHADVGTTVQVRVRPTSGGADVDVIDEGPGMDPATAREAFEPFTQGARSAAEARPGAGVGLAVVRRLVGMHGGAVNLMHATGHCHFRVTLPSTPATRRGRRPVDAPVEGPLRADGDLRVVVVDRAGTAHHLLELLPESWDVTVLSGPLLVQRDAVRHDLAVVLPAATGQVQEQLAPILGAVGDVPVLVVVEGDEQEVRSEVLALGAQDVLELSSITERTMPRACWAAIERQRLRVQVEQLAKHVTASESRYRRLADRAGDIVYVLEIKPEVRFALLNQAWEQVTGMSVMEAMLEPQAAFDLLVPESLERVLRLFAEPTAIGDEPMALQLRTRDDRLIWLEHVFTPTFDHDGELAEVMVVARDVTSRHEESEALREELERKVQSLERLRSQKLEDIGRLSAGIAHELNTPLQFVTDNTQFVLDVHGDDQPAEELLAEVSVALGESLDGLARMAHLVRALKEFSHPGTEDRTECDLVHLVELTSTVARNEWKYVADLDLDLADDLPPVWCSGDQIGQVLLNLIVNAAQAIREAGRGHGRIRVSAVREGDEVVVRVSDTGAGIPPDARGRIFEPFFTTKPVGVGTGQGLAIAWTIVHDRHHGELLVEHTGAEGTTMAMRLPVQTP